MGNDEQPVKSNSSTCLVRHSVRESFFDLLNPPLHLWAPIDRRIG